MTRSWITRLRDWIWDYIELIVWELFRNVQSQCAQLWASPPFHGLRWCFGNAGSLCVPSVCTFLQVMNGLMQTTGWPAVVACVGNWFGKGK